MRGSKVKSADVWGIGEGGMSKIYNAIFILEWLRVAHNLANAYFQLRSMRYWRVGPYERKACFY